MINVPYYEPCSCGYCVQQAKQEAEHNDDLTLEEAMEGRWHAKTRQAARAVPFNFSNRVQNVVEDFFKEFEEYPNSRLSVNRRIRQAKRHTDIERHIYPHALRATAATYHAYKGLPALALQNLMGWSNLETAQKYLRKSAGATKKALNEIHRGVEGNG